MNVAKVIFMPSAESDLTAIGLWIAADNPSRAMTFLDEVRGVCSRLADAPKAYPIVERYRSIGVRRRAFGNYLIFYRIGAEHIEVLHVLHGARDYSAILKAELE